MTAEAISHPPALTVGRDVQYRYIFLPLINKEIVEFQFICHGVRSMLPYAESLWVYIFIMSPIKCKYDTIKKLEVCTNIILHLAPDR